MRIVSLLPSVTEILFGIGAGDEVVGVTHECDYPAEALALPKVTSASSPALETPREIDRHVRAAVHAGSTLYNLDRDLLETLNPDLIVTQELCAVCAVSYEIVASAAKRLRTDLRVISLEPKSVDDVLETIRFVGEITEHLEQARDLIASLQTRLRAISHSDKACPERRTLVLEWTDPPMSAGHWIPEIVQMAGGTPILANPETNSQRLDWIRIADADPDAVIVAPCGLDLTKTERAIAELDAIEGWRSLRARIGGRVLALDGNAYLSRPGPRLIDAAEIIAQWYTSQAEYAG